MPAPTAGVAIALWLNITFRRGNMTVDDYLGRVSSPARRRCRRRRPRASPRFAKRIERALALARKRIAPNPTDADAHYQLGAAMGLRASYIATVEGSVIGRVPRRARGVRRARDGPGRSTPRRKDAGLIVGTYRYIVATLALPLRLGRLHGRLRRRQGARHPDGRGGGRVRR